MGFDNEQLQAIHSTGSNIIVSASAGAGKTGVLVARLLKRNIDDRIPIDRILALTFTAAAASEMKKRLASGLHDRFTTTDDEELKSYLSEQLILLESAQITTIDSYCLSIIEKYCNVLGLDPATAKNVLNGSISSLYNKQAYDEVIRLYSKEHHAIILKLLETFGNRSEDYDTLFEILKKMSDYAESSRNPEEWYAHTKQMYQPVSHFEDLPEETKDDFFDYLKISMQRIQEDLSLMEKFVLDSEKIDPSDITSRQNGCINCLNALNEKNYDRFDLYFRTFCTLPNPSDGKNEPYTAARKKMLDHSKKIGEILFDRSVFVKDHNDNYEIVQTLLDLSKLTHDKFVEIKQKNACMDFTDMERYACEILDKNDGSIANIIRQQYDEIMVDEFQDTSELQNYIIDRISNGKNVFRVGDVKQSIYAFRQAKPELMRSIMKDPSVKRITLKHNYRSMDSIVQFSNLLFSLLMNIEGCKDTYLEEDTVTIGRGAQEETITPIEFTAIHVEKDTEDNNQNTDNNNDPDNKNDNSETPENKRLKANWIAQKMIILYNADPHLHWKDFAVLVKSHADKVQLRSAFDFYGIPYDIDAREGFYQSILCLTISSIVQAMLNPYDEIALLAVCTSSLFQMNDDELARCKINYKNFYTGVMERHPEVFDLLKHFKKIAETDGLVSFLNEVACTNSFYENLSSLQQSNFDFLLETVSNSNIHDLYTFSQSMIAGSDEKSSEAMSKGKNDDVVKVTTIHQSKGLQYGIVFLWGTSTNRFMDQANPVLLDAEGHIALNHTSLPARIVRPTIERIGISNRLDQEDIEEFIRLLYVAVTRAEKRLFVVDVIKNEIEVSKPSLTLLHQRKGFTDLFLSVLEPSDLFQINEIQPDDITNFHAPKVETHYVSELPRLSFQPELFKPSLTPSSTEFSTLPSLDPNTSNKGTLFGTTVHETLEKLPLRSWTFDDLANVDLSNEYKTKILTFGKSDLYQSCLSMDVHKEMNFYVECEDVIIEGAMDFVAIGSDKIVLIDYKTDHASLNEIRTRYQAQLNTYRKALKELYPGKSISVYAYSFHNDKAIEIPERLQ